MKYSSLVFIQFMDLDSLSVVEFTYDRKISTDTLPDSQVGKEAGLLQACDP